MESARIIVAMSSDISRSKLKIILTENGYSVVEQAKDGHECLRKMRTLRPDLVILDYNLPLMNGYEVSKVACEDKICDVILTTTAAEENLVDNVKLGSGFVCMIKPLNKINLTNTIDLMLKNKSRILELEKVIEDLKCSLDTRKEVEKAKGLLMKHLSISEPEAFKKIQKQSMDHGIPMKEIAKAIILAYDI